MRRGELYTVLLCLVLVLAGCTDGEPGPRPREQSTPLATAAPPTTPTLDETLANCGTPDAPPELSISEREAIQIAFGNRKEATCDRFETSLRKHKGRSYWEVRLGRKGAYGCEHTRGIYADSGELLAEASGSCT